MSQTDVILVNEQDEPVGLMEKMEAHRKGLLHRAFSVFIFDEQGRMLLQQRAWEKYHGGGLWTNACCSHPFPEEPVDAAARRRLKEELGFSVPVEEIFAFTYRADVENGLIEHEYDHVFAGHFNGAPEPDPGEVAGFRYEHLDAIRSSLETEPQAYTAWFRIAFPRVEEWWKARDRQSEPTTSGNDL